MTTKFEFLFKLEFLQSWTSSLISSISPTIIHNIGKYYMLKKVFYLSAIEDLEGDYLEFGIFTGSSFCHSMKCCQKSAHLNPKMLDTRFFGFDSFSGFGPLPNEDRHPFYVDEYFVTSQKKVDDRIKSIARGLTYKLIPGFFSDSLKEGADKIGVRKARIIFIDSDTYVSSKDALTFTLPTLQQGTYIVLDDYYSFKGSKDKGVARAFSEFVKLNKLEMRHVFTYGMGGAVYVVAEEPRYVKNAL